MKEFMAAAFPWLLTGLALAVIAAAFAKAQIKETEKNLARRTAAGACLGLLFGVALGSSGFRGSHAFCVAAGPLWGMAVASLISSNKKAK